MRLNVWDFGGQEIMHSTHQFFLTERSLYLIVLSGREGREEEDAEYWLRYVESFGGDSPAIVVFNKSREHPADVQDKRVFVNVTGPARSRRLLAVIRSDFDRTHGDIRNLKPQEMVPIPEAPDAVVPYEKLEAMEREGVRTFHEYAGGRVLELDVRALLDGVDLEERRRRGRDVDSRKRPVRLFYSYSHRDEALRNELETHLKILQRRGLIEGWNDRKIEAGDDWREQINVNLERAEIILLLVSADFIASGYCYEIEMRAALERRKKGEAEVLPVKLRDANLNGAEFSDLQYLPKGGKAVTLWDNKDSAWRSVSEGIERVAVRLRGERV